MTNLNARFKIGDYQSEQKACAIARAHGLVIFKSASIFASLALACALSLGCSDKKAKEQSPPPLQTATQLIDQGRYDESIRILESDRAPRDDSKVTTALASAYAARAGVRVEDFWGFVIGYDRLLFAAPSSNDTVPISIDVNSLPAGFSRSTVDFLKNLNVNFAQVNSIIARIKQIPYVPAERREDLNHAIGVLSRTIQPGARLYRSVLSVIVLQSEFKDLAPNLNEWAKSNYSLCDEKLATIADLLVDVRDRLFWMTDDLAYAYPTKADQFHQLQTQIHESDRLFVSLKDAKERLPCRR